jgi:HD-GYP domain-containing protein (c-di-GMP phosphodiesterase class II)
MNISPAKRYRLILSAVHMVYRLVNSTYTVKELTLRLTRLLCQFIRASSASVYILDANKKSIAEASYNNQINIWREGPGDLKAIYGLSAAREVIGVTRGDTVFARACIGLPLVADDYLGAIFVRRLAGDRPFDAFDREMLSVFAEQAVTAVKNLQFNEEHEQVILGSIKSIGNFLKKKGGWGMTHPPAYTHIVKMLGRQLKVSREGMRSLEYASLLHDIGVIDIPFSILAKRGSLTSREFKIIRRHTAHSVALIKPVAFLKPVLPVILYHHEKYDGTGYPSGLKKEQIPLGARIIAVADAFEAMVQERPYRAPVAVDAAISEIERNSGTQFDPRVVEAFLLLARQKNFRKFLSLFRRQAYNAVHEY